MIRKLNHEKSRNCFSSQSIIRRIKCFPLSTLLVLVIWVLCLIPIPDNVPFGDVPMMDKWTHFVMYGGTCSVIWFEYLRSHQSLNKQKLFLWAWLAPTLMGGVIELVQAYCTTNRSGEWLDLAADAVGCTLAVGVGLLLRRIIKCKKETM